MSQMGSMQFQPIRISPMIKKIMIINFFVWIILQIIVDRFFLNNMITNLGAMTPSKTIYHFYIWQPFTYMFFHSDEGVLHFFFNMIMLWMFGSELEYRWGGKAFLTYYLVCGVGAAIIYLLGVVAYGLITGTEPAVFNIKVLGASGAIFGLLLAYGILFGERVIYFFMIFPMKAKYFVAILGLIEFVTLLVQPNNGVANLAHLGGLIAGFAYLFGWTRYKQSRWRKAKSGKGRRNLRLVVNNDESDSDGPKYWN